MPTHKAIHIGKSHHPPHKPKLGKECVCPNARSEKKSTIAQQLSIRPADRPSTSNTSVER